jgi:hypothetical protein
MHVRKAVCCYCMYSFIVRKKDIEHEVTRSVSCKIHVALYGIQTVVLRPLKSTTIIMGARTFV